MELPTGAAAALGVFGPDGNFLTPANLPSSRHVRWVVRRKAELIAAVRGGLITLNDACERLLTAARGAMNGMMAEVVEDHIQMHMMEANRKPTRNEIEAADELVDVLRSYI